MQELLYSDPEGTYMLLDYAPSHSQMVIRKRDKVAKTNTDLFFKPVCNIQLNVRLEGIKVFKVPRAGHFFDYPNATHRKEIYKIIDNTGHCGYIDASVFVVFRNSLDILETSLGDFTWSVENEEIYSAIIN
jgi:hypothetical protein